MKRLVGILALIAVLAFAGSAILWGPDGCLVERAKLARQEGDFSAIANAIKTYTINAGRPPDTEQGLMALVAEPVAGPKPRRWVQVMKKVPTDPWGNPYRYRLLSEEYRKWRFELRSAGKDGILQTEDDWAKAIDWER